MAAGVGRVRSLAFLSLLQWCSLACHTYGLSKIAGAKTFPHSLPSSLRTRAQTQSRLSPLSGRRTKTHTTIFTSCPGKKARSG